MTLVSASARAWSTRGRASSSLKEEITSSASSFISALAALMASRAVFRSGAAPASISPFWAVIFRRMSRVAAATAASFSLTRASLMPPSAPTALNLMVGFSSSASFSSSSAASFLAGAHFSASSAAMRTRMDFSAASSLTSGPAAEAAQIRPRTPAI